MMDRVAATWDGLLVLNIVVCASASPKPDFSSELLLLLMKGARGHRIHSRSRMSRLQLLDVSPGDCGILSLLCTQRVFDKRRTIVLR